MGISDSFSVYNLEIAFGTSCCLLLFVMIVLAAISILQWKQISRLTAFFNGHQPDDERQPIYRHDENDNELANVNNNQACFHQNASINEVIELIFPRELPIQHLRNITALKAFHKSQREALKNYSANQGRLMRIKVSSFVLASVYSLKNC